MARCLKVGVGVLAAAGLMVSCSQSDVDEARDAASDVFAEIQFAGAHEVTDKEPTNDGYLYDVVVDGSFTEQDLTMPNGFVEGPLDDQLDFKGPDPVREDLDCIITVGLPEDVEIERTISFDVACGFHDATD